MISVDPGIGGAIVLWAGGKVTAIYDMPTKQAGSKKVVDGEEVRRIFMSGVSYSEVVVEQVGASPRGGTASMFNFGMSFGIILGVAAGCGGKVHTITPQKWKAARGLLKKEKDAARLLAIELYPEAKKYLSRKKDVDRADAILIGDYFLRFGGGK